MSATVTIKITPHAALIKTRRSKLAPRKEKWGHK
jgi:hypothetical protein